MVAKELRRYTFYYIKPAARLCLITVFLTSTISISFSWSSTSVISLVLLLVSYLFFKHKDEKSRVKVAISAKDIHNPYMGKTGSSFLTSEKEVQIALAIENYVVDDARHTNCLERFEIIKASTECVFAKKAKLWGCCDYDETISLEENMKRIYPTLLKFTLAFLDLGLGAFVVELPGSLFGHDITVFANAVRRSLLTFRLEDMKRFYKQMLKKKGKMVTESLQESSERPFLEDTTSWERRNWVFEINSVTFFITTFAPFYPETNSRYNFGSKNCYILFQPELSFAVHNLPSDTPATSWTCPVTVRDKIRVAYHEAGRYYEPPLKQDEPMVYDIVKRISPEDEAVRWWDINDQRGTGTSKDDSGP